MRGVCIPATVDRPHLSCRQNYMQLLPHIPLDYSQIIQENRETAETELAGCVGGEAHALPHFFSADRQVQIS